MVTPAVGEARQRHRRHARAEAGFAAAAGDVHVPVDEAGNQAPTVQVDVVADRAQRGRQLDAIRAHPEDLAAAEQQMLRAQRFGA